MIINSITLKNFKSYEQETTIDLKPADGKNIILIGGENGAGKSTLFEAIKVCIYGSTAFGYLGQNHFYTDKIKSMISNNAYSNQDIETFVKLDISFSQGMEKVNYTLIRKWTYTRQKIKESFSVFAGRKELTDEDFNYFEEFLKSELPPSLFDFFFFDGEELNTMFTAHNDSNDLKHAVLQLLNFNSFELLRRQLLQYNRAAAKNDKELKAAQEQYDSCTKQLDIAHETIRNYEEKIKKLEHALENKCIEKKNLNREFRRNGGILEEERNQLNAKIASTENRRSELSVGIRDYCNDTLPFLLLSKQLKKLSKQLKLEEEKNSYLSIERKLSSDVIANAYNTILQENKLSADKAKTVSENILNQLFDVAEIKDTTSILGLSKEQEHTVMSVCNNILRNQTDILSSYEKMNQLSEELKQLRQKLNSSVSNDLLKEYLDDIARLNQEENALLVELQCKKAELEMETKRIPLLKLNLTKARNQTLALLQKSNISEMSSQLTGFLEELLETLTESKVDLIEKEFISIFNQIIRKNNFIDTLKLNKNFNSTLYITKDYDAQNIINIIENIGFDNLEDKYGALFVEELSAYTKETDEKKIKQKLNECLFNGLISLHTKVDIKSLSNGERQVYVLCLIWAILKVSNVDIPFIIDTPYARIDTTHRNGLSTLYLPNISKQVIILSTNEEIDEELYRTIKPYVCNEYLLVYDTATRRTTVKNNYFEV